MGHGALAIASGVREHPRFGLDETLALTPDGDGISIKDVVAHRARAHARAGS